MAFIIFLLLLAMPVIEIIVFIQAGAVIGWVQVILLTIATAVGGAVLIRLQGFQALRQLQQNMADGKPPVAPVVDGVFLMMAAPLLMTPGFVTDAFGFTLLIPAVRRAIARYALSKLKAQMDSGKVTIIRMP